MRRTGGDVGVELARRRPREYGGRRRPLRLDRRKPPAEDLGEPVPVERDVKHPRPDVAAEVSKHRAPHPIRRPGRRRSASARRLGCEPMVERNVHPWRASTFPIAVAPTGPEPNTSEGTSLGDGSSSACAQTTTGTSSCSSAAHGVAAMVAIVGTTTTAYRPHPPAADRLARPARGCRSARWPPPHRRSRVPAAGGPLRVRPCSARPGLPACSRTQSRASRQSQLHSTAQVYPTLMAPSSTIVAAVT